MPPLTAILLWPLVVMILFARLDLPKALSWSIIAGYLLLPENTRYNLPMFPSLDKNSMPSLVAAVMAVIVGRAARTAGPPGTERPGPSMQPGWLPRNPIGLVLTLALIAGALLTVLSNGDRLVYGTTSIRGLSLYDGFSALLTTTVSLLPMLLARKYLATPETHRTLLLILCIAGLIYTLPALYEVRMSPQLNRMVYGFFPSSWIQTLRDGGYRPLVFLRQGLWLSMFLLIACLATLALFRLEEPRRKALYAGIALWIFMTLVLSKSLGAFLIALVLIPAILVLNTRLQLVFAAVIAAAVLFYPTLRGTGKIPVDRVVSLAAQIDPGRSRSLQFRLNNEDILLAKANQRPLFGWGGWGRARVYNDRGRDISTTDGRWVISMGSEGWFGYLARFGLLTIPMILLALRRRKYEVTMATSALCLILAGNLVDLIPNATLTPVTWLMAGALLGRLEVRAESLDTTAPDPEQGGPDRTPRYSRAKPVQGRRPRPDAPPRSKPGYTRYSRTPHHTEPPEN